jgi:hypothetical protein
LALENRGRRFVERKLRHECDRKAEIRDSMATLSCGAMGLMLREKDEPIHQKKGVTD